MIDKDYKPSPSFRGSEGDYSVDDRGPEAIKEDILDIMRMFDPDAKHKADPDRGFNDETQGGIGFDNLKFKFSDEGMAKRIGAVFEGKATNLQDAIDLLHKLCDELEKKKQDQLTFDEVPTKGSSNPVTSNGIKAELDLKAPVESPSFTGKPTAPDPETDKGIATKGYTDSQITKGLKKKADKSDTLKGYGITDAYTKEETDSKINSLGDAKQDRLTFDTEPAEGSTNPVTSEGIRRYVKDVADSIKNISFSKVEALPEAGESNVIYLVRNESIDGNDRYNEYIWLESAQMYEAIGSINAGEILYSDLTLQVKDERLYVSRESGESTTRDAMMQCLYNTTEGWNNQPELIARKGVLYVYTDYGAAESGNTCQGMKLGDGETLLSDLPFLDEQYFMHINNSDIHVTADEKMRWNSGGGSGGGSGGMQMSVGGADEENLVFASAGSGTKMSVSDEDSNLIFSNN